MTQVFDEAGTVHPVTVVQAGPCRVMQVKNVTVDGYDAVQLGYQDAKPQRSTRPLVGHAAKAGAKVQRVLRELRLATPAQAQLGETWTVAAFKDVAFVDVIGTSKGKGFQGVMKRHHFGGQPASHGTERKHRSPGSLSSHGSDRGHGGNIKKGKRMAGHMGFDRVTSRNHQLVGIDAENHLLLIQGPVPGPAGGYVFIRKSITARVAPVRKEA